MALTERLIRGAIAGLAATIPMSAVMSLWHRRLPWHEREPLPPAKITDTLLRKVGLEREVPEPAQTGLTAINHLAYGASIGAVFEGLNDPQTPPSIGRGIGYGLAIWAGSYLGWLPAAGLHRPATRDSLERNLLMIGAHVVWGASLSWTLQRLHELKPRPRTKSGGGPSSGMRVATRSAQRQLSARGKE